MIECRICGKEIELDKPHFKAENQYLCSPKCHAEQYYLNKIEQMNCGRLVTTKTNVFYIGNEDSISNCRGFGGKKFKIKWLNLEKGIDISSNLWYNISIDEIPEKYKRFFEQNAILEEI